MNNLTLKCYQSTYSEHAHNHEQWVIPLNGELEININGEQLLITQDQPAFIPTNALHRFRANTNEPFIVINTYRLTNGLHLPLQFKLDANGLLLQKLARETLSQTESSILQHSFYNLFIEIFSNQFYLVTDKYLAKAKQFIETNISLEFNLKDIAQYCCLSVRQLQRKFDTELGTNIQQYIQEQKIAKAQQLLKNTSLPITIIAESIGFKNPAAFARTFRQQTQLTASQYRKCHKLHKKCQI